jgi:hypothetical protein
MAREQITKPELETIDGLHFYRYQLDWIERMTEVSGWTVKEWIEYVISRVVLSHVEARDYSTIPDERLKADLIEDRRNKHSDS